MDKTLTKTKRNRLRMETYRQERCSKNQKQKIREYDRKRAAATRLKKKFKQESNREKSWKRSKKYRDSKEIPTSPEKFVKKVCNIAKNSPRKTKIMTDTMATHNFAVIMSRPTLSILQLQSLQNKNQSKEHAKLVEEFKSQYGSLRKASIATNVQWPTFHRLCRPVQNKIKARRQKWVDIRSFYKLENVSHKLPSTQCNGKRYLTRTLEESYTMYKDDCETKLKKAVCFSTFARL